MRLTINLRGKPRKQWTCLFAKTLPEITAGIAELKKLDPAGDDALVVETLGVSTEEDICAIKSYADIHTLCRKADISINVERLRNDDISDRLIIMIDRRLPYEASIHRHSLQSSGNCDCGPVCQYPG